RLLLSSPSALAYSFSSTKLVALFSRFVRFKRFHFAKPFFFVFAFYLVLHLLWWEGKTSCFF
ncbi:hypothetical protein, partial [Staphylococcus aureus]|uniref:hypothetical protein n=1 Tax=Staphylococcus aureus TaxID=1280 RepID=UPI001A922942